ncbi:MAG: helix-turn-helix transcriptional regulator [Campylobacterales bacterium]|nr:helix-turn-helix transcriptional regulator [Campylobacterales bacterium]
MIKSSLEFHQKDIDSFYKLVGYNVKRLRNLHEVSQLEVSFAMGHKSVSLLSMAELCLDKKRFNLEHLYKLAQIFDCDICEFFKPIEATQSTDIDTAPASNQQN